MKLVRKEPLCNFCADCVQCGRKTRFVNVYLCSKCGQEFYSNDEEEFCIDCRMAESEEEDG